MLEQIRRGRCTQSVHVGQLLTSRSANIEIRKPPSRSPDLYTYFTHGPSRGRRRSSALPLSRDQLDRASVRRVERQGVDARRQISIQRSRSNSTRQTAGRSGAPVKCQRRHPCPGPDKCRPADCWPIGRPRRLFATRLGDKCDESWRDGCHIGDEGVVGVPVEVLTAAWPSPGPSRGPARVTRGAGRGLEARRWPQIGQ
jgi:hypothetical protein